MAAAVIPIAIHLVRRMKARTVPFSSLLFLKATPYELVRKRRLRDRLLMALRCSLLVLLALVFARPFVPADKIPLVSSRENESIVLLVDRSFSMRYGDHFERAVALARDRIDRASDADEITVVAFDDRVQVLGEAATGRLAAAAALATIEPGYRATDYFPVLQRAEEILQDARHPRRVIALFSDLQDAGWSRSLEDWEFQEGIVFEPMPIELGEVANGYVEAFEQNTRMLGGRGVARFDARIGGAVEHPTDVVLELDGMEAAREVLESGRTNVSFQHAYSRTGFFQGVLRLPGDPLTADDLFFFTDHFRGRPQILIVDPSGSGWTSDAFFLRHAFDLGDAARYEVSQSTSFTSLAGVDILFLSLNGALTEAQTGALQRFVDEGGGAILSVAPGADPSRVSEALAALGIGRIEGIVDARRELGYEAIIGEVDLRHAIFQPFGSNETSAILRPRFRRFARLNPAADVRVLGRFDSGDPFLVQRERGRGRIMFHASTFGTAWTDMPLDEMYVPFLYELVGFARRAAGERRNFTIGESVPIAGRPGGSVEVRTPDGRIYSVDVDADGRGRFDRTDIPGHYRASGAGGPEFFSVNVDPRESVLDFRSAEDVYAAVMPRPSDTPVTPEQAVAAVQSEERNQKMWKWLLLVVIALFGMETYLANRPVDDRRTPNGSRSKSAGKGGRRWTGITMPYRRSLSTQPSEVGDEV